MAHEWTWTWCRVHRTRFYRCTAHLSGENLTIHHAAVVDDFGNLVVLHD